jgi:hypothetical protein
MVEETIIIKTEIEGLDKTITSVREMRKEIQSLRGQMIGASEEDLVLLSKRASELQAELNRTNNLVTSSGSQFVNFSTILGRTAKAIRRLDFGDAAEGMKAMALQIKTFSFKEVISGLRLMTAGIWQMTVAILANPIGLIAAAVIALGAAIWLLKDRIPFLTDAFEAMGEMLDYVIGLFKDLTDWLGITRFEAEETADKVIESSRRQQQELKRITDLTISEYDRQIRKQRALGQSTEDLERDRLNIQRTSVEDNIRLLNEEQQAIINRAGSYKRLTDEQKKQVDELSLTIASENERRKNLITDIEIFDITSTNKRLAAETDALNRRLKANEEYKKNLERINNFIADGELKAKRELIDFSQESKAYKDYQKSLLDEFEKYKKLKNDIEKNIGSEEIKKLINDEDLKSDISEKRRQLLEAAEKAHLERRKQINDIFITQGNLSNINYTKTSLKTQEELVKFADRFYTDTKKSVKLTSEEYEEYARLMGETLDLTSVKKVTDEFGDFYIVQRKVSDQQVSLLEDLESYFQAMNIEIFSQEMLNSQKFSSEQLSFIHKQYLAEKEWGEKSSSLFLGKLLDQEMAKFNLHYDRRRQILIELYKVERKELTDAAEADRLRFDDNKIKKITTLDAQRVELLKQSILDINSLRDNDEISEEEYRTRLLQLQSDYVTEFDAQQILNYIERIKNSEQHYDDLTNIEKNWFIEKLGLSKENWQKEYEEQLINYEIITNDLLAHNEKIKNLELKHKNDLSKLNAEYVRESLNNSRKLEDNERASVAVRQNIQLSYVRTLTDSMLAIQGLTEQGSIAYKAIGLAGLAAGLAQSLQNIEVSATTAQAQATLVGTPAAGIAAYKAVKTATIPAVLSTAVKGYTLLKSAPPVNIGGGDSGGGNIPESQPVRPGSQPGFDIYRTGLSGDSSVGGGQVSPSYILESELTSSEERRRILLNRGRL